MDTEPSAKHQEHYEDEDCSLEECAEYEVGLIEYAYAKLDKEAAIREYGTEI